MNPWKRPRDNNWIGVILLYFAGYALTPALIYFADEVYPNDTLSAFIFYGGNLFISLILIIISRQMTVFLKWWLIPLIFSPLSLAIIIIILTNILMALGLIQI